MIDENATGTAAGPGVRLRKCHRRHFQVDMESQAIKNCKDCMAYFSLFLQNEPNFRGQLERGVRDPRPATLQVVRQALERAGVEFIDEKAARAEAVRTPQLSGGLKRLSHQRLQRCFSFF